LIIACWFVAIPATMRAKLRTTRPVGRRELAKTCADAAMVGLGIGLSVATAVFLAAAVLVQLSDQAP